MRHAMRDSKHVQLYTKPHPKKDLAYISLFSLMSCLSSQLLHSTESSSGGGGGKLVTYAMLFAILIKQALILIPISLDMLQLHTCLSLNSSMKFLKHTQHLIFCFQGVSPYISWIIIKSSIHGFLEGWDMLKATLISFLAKQWTHFFKKTFFNPEKRFFLTKLVKPFSLMWLSLLCQSSVASLSLSTALIVEYDIFISMRYNDDCFKSLATTIIPQMSFHWSSLKCCKTYNRQVYSQKSNQNKYQEYMFHILQKQLCTIIGLQVHISYTNGLR